MTWSVASVLLPAFLDSSDQQWDLGEFDQKGTTATRWGTKEELLRLTSTAKTHGVDILIDAVLNVGRATRLCA